MSDLLLFVTNPGANPLIATITKVKLLLEQRREPFYATVSSRLNRGDTGLWSFNSEKVLFRFAFGDEQTFRSNVSLKTFLTK